jgi:hypothetical protein
MKKIFILFCVVLSACSGPRHSKIVSFTPASVVVDYTDTGDLVEATDQAQRYCSSINKDAQYVNTKDDFAVSSFGWKKTAFFNCIAKEHGVSNSHVGSSGGNTIINNPPAIINNSK